MTILYRTAKFKSANIFVSAALDQTAKFKDHQYFRLYGIGFFCEVHSYLQIIARYLPRLPSFRENTNHRCRAYVTSVDSKWCLYVNAGTYSACTLYTVGVARCIPSNAHQEGIHVPYVCTCTHVHVHVQERLPGANTDRDHILTCYDSLNGVLKVLFCD